MTPKEQGTNMLQNTEHVSFPAFSVSLPMWALPVSLLSILASH